MNDSSPDREQRTTAASRQISHRHQLAKLRRQLTAYTNAVTTPKYRPHDPYVCAFRIKLVEPDYVVAAREKREASEGVYWIVPCEPGVSPVAELGDFVAEQSPVPDAYYVTLRNGKSFCMRGDPFLHLFEQQS